MAAQLGYCGLDRRRLPLSGGELRGCWAAGPARSADSTTATAALDLDEPPSPALRLRDFVPVELVRREAAVARPRKRLAGGEPAAPAAPATAGPPQDSAPAWADPFTLFVDADL